MCNLVFFSPIILFVHNSLNYSKHDWDHGFMGGQPHDTSNKNKVQQYSILRERKGFLRWLESYSFTNSNVCAVWVSHFVCFFFSFHFKLITSFSLIILIFEVCELYYYSVYALMSSYIIIVLDGQN